MQIFSIGELNAQLERSKIISSYIYNFANNLEWSNNKFSEFNITLISSNTEIIEELTKMSKNQKINKKNISLSVLSKPNNLIQNAQMIFITNDELSYYMAVFDQIEGKEILLVSENFDNKSYVMLNLYDTQDETVLFEINKPNIINQKLKLSDNLLLLGGTEIDIAAIYLKSQHSLRAMELRINSFNDQYDSLLQKIKKSNFLVTKKQNQINKQSTQIDSQKIFQAKQLLKINEYKNVIEKQLLQLQTEQVLLRQMTDSLGKNETALKKQYIEMQDSKKILNIQTAEIDSINNEIVQRNLILSDKDTVIDKQRQNMYLLGIITIIIVLLVFVVLFAYRQNHKKSKKLKLQKKEIDVINAQLLENNEELRASLEEIKKMQQQLVQTKKMASLGILSAGIAHEINNPINFVYAGINSLLRDFEDIEPVINEISKINPDTENIKEKLLQIEKLKEENYFNEAFSAIPEIINDIKLGADRTAEIVKGLRSFSRIDKGELHYFDIHHGIDTSLLLLRNKYKNHIEIIKDFGNDIPELKCHSGKVNQAFLNILSNAIDAISEEGKIWITTKILDKNISISIRDNGCGMSKEQLENIFDPFFTTKPIGEGTGLGLSITYGIIEEHNGKIQIKSELEKGSEIIILLPIT